MAECPGGRTGRGTRSQFRLGIPGSGGFLKGSYPIRLGDIMDAGQSSQTGILSASDIISPNKGTRTRTVREYEQTISELKKENFDLKLRVFLFEEAMNKNSRKDKDCSSPNKDNTVEVIVQLKLETESLRNELSHKEKLLQDTLDRAEKWETEFKELEKKNAELQLELASLSELPSKQEFMLLGDEKENLLKENMFFKRELLEKNEEIDILNQKLEILSTQNNNLEEKIKKRSLAIQSFVYKNFKEKEMLPDELRSVVISAAQAAKNRNKEDLAIAVKSFSSALSQIMASPLKTSLSESEEKENIGSSQAKCLKEEFLEKTSMFLPSQSESCTELSRIQNLKEVLAERNSPVSQQLCNLDSVFQDSFIRGKILNENSVNVAEKDVIDFINSSIPFCAAENESTVSYSNMPSSQQCSFSEHNLINIRDIVSPAEPSDLKQHSKTLLKDSVSHTSNSKEYLKVLKENEQLKVKIEEHHAIICDLRSTCQELELRKVQLEELQNAVSKASECYHAYVQTDIGGNDLIQLYETAKMKKDATLSENIDELREDILMLLLAIEGKNKELTEVKETLSAVQADLKNVMNSSKSAVEKDCMGERNELHERLAFSCSVNVELMKHLRNLEAFMEDLLQHKFDSSMESINERSDFLSNVSRCLNESLKLSNVLSDHLSICEGSKLFETCESFLVKSANYSDEKSLPHLDVSELNVPEYCTASVQGIRVSEEYFPYVCKDNVQRIGKEALDSLLMDGGLLCIRCSHQVNYPLNMSEISHTTRNSTNHASKNIGYLSSDSDIWSEPDRDVSMQRIGINLQYSPVTSKSPRKLRSKEKRINRLSPDHNTSSSEVQHCPKQRRNGTACRRLFVKENVKQQDFTLEKYYFILAEKFSKLQSLLNGLENIKDGEISDEICKKLNGVMTSLGEALQKLQNAKEHSRNFNPVCGRCVMLDLLMDLKTFHNEVDIHTVSSRRQAEILQHIWKEIHLLKEDCEEPFSLFETKIDKVSKSTQSEPSFSTGIDKVSKSTKSESLLSTVVDKVSKSTQSEPLFSTGVDKLSKSTQSDPLLENNQIKINKLERTIIDLSNKNKNLMENLNELNSVLVKERSVLESVKAENLTLSNHVNHLKDGLSDMKHKESELAMKNAELVEKLANIKKNNSELNNVLKDLEQKRNESNIVLDKLTAELQKNKIDLENMSTKCIQYERELSEQIRLKETYEEKLKNLETTSCNEKENFLNQIKNLISEKDSNAKKLSSMQEKMQVLEKENSGLNYDLNASHTELCSLQEIVEKHKNANESLNTICKELQKELKNTNDQLLNVKEQFNSYKKETAIKLKSADEYHRQLKKLEAKSLSEEKKLGNEISRLSAERDDIFQKLKDEQDYSEKLMLEKTELNQKLLESCQKISNLQQSNEELENTHINLLRENEHVQSALLSSNSKCDALSNDLMHIRETLQNLEYRCAAYEKELVASAGMKDNLVECLLNINYEFSANRQKLNEICKAYDHRSSMSLDDTYISDFIPVIDEDHVKILCHNVDSESKKLLKSVDVLLEIMKNYQLKSQEIKSAEEKCHIKDMNLKKEIDFLSREIQHLKSQKDHLERIIGDQQKSLIESQKSLRFSSFEIQNLKGKLKEAENEIEKGRLLLKIKEDEITMLQERVFNLQTDIHRIKGETADLLNKRSSFQEFLYKSDSASTDNSLPSQLVTEVTLQQETQSKDIEEPSQSADESATSGNASDILKSTWGEKYLKKYHSLQTKLALYKKRIEILETEKNRLRESLNKFQNSRSSPSRMKDQEPGSKKSLDLESELERKKAFINELKSELLKTCNALISKEEEIEKLTAKLSECETKSKSPTFEMIGDHSRIETKTVDTHVKNLKNYKWKLIQMIFDIQREFYEKRGIHLNYFEKFKDHVNNLYSLHLTHPLTKSESLPLLDSHSMHQRQTDDRFKNLVGLELDIECLENLKIFLNRFFVPCVFETSHTVDLESKKSLYSLREGEDIVAEKQIIEAGVDKTEKLKKAEFLDTLCCRYLSDFVPFYKKDFSENSYSFETFAMNVSNHLDFIENFFKAVNECKGLNRFEFSSKDFEDKAEAKSLLQKMVKEINILYAGGEKLFSLNAVLKHLDLFTLPLPKTASKQDMSDRESVLSEETITISQSESPVSFEEICPIKLPYSETLNLEENLISPQPSELVGTVTEPQSVKMTAIGSSCDSVCHRSHYSSPDLGIESDPNHESSVPEQKEDGISKYQKSILEEPKFIVKPQPKTAFTSTDSAGRWKGTNFAGDTLYSIGNLPHYELLKREIQESLVGIKSVLSRTGDGLHHIAKYTSPRKTLEYSTLKAIKDTCGNIEVCLKEAYKLVGKFWIASCPSEQEWNFLLEENQTLYQQLTNLKNTMQQKENEFKKAMGKLEHAQLLKANMEKKISKKLVKTKKVIRQAELKLLENKCQNFPPVPKFPLEQASSNLLQDL